MSAFAGAALPLSARDAAGVAPGSPRRARPVSASAHRHAPIRSRASPKPPAPRRVAVRARAASERTVGEAVTYSFDVAGNASATAPKTAKTDAAATETRFVSEDVSGTPSKRAPFQTTDPSAANADAAVAEVLATIADTDSGRNVTPEQRRATDANIALLEAVGATQTPNALNNPLIFGDYDVSYVSTGGRQIGNPAGGRFRGGLGSALFRTVGLEQNLYEPDVVVNRVAFLVFGLIPGEVVLQGTFAPVEVEAETAAEAAAAREAARERDGVGATKSAKKKTEAEKKRARDGAFAVARDAENEKYAGDGMTVRAHFESPRITLGGLPAFSVGPKSSVVLSTTYLDEDVRLGKGSRGSLFVFARKSAAQAERDRARWKVGGFGVSVMLACTAALVFFAVRRFRAGGVTELAVATAAAVLASAALALVMRQGGIVAEDADYEEKYRAQAQRARERAARARNKEP